MRLGEYTNTGTLSRARFGRQFGTHPKICVATFFTEFRVDANYDITP